MNTLINALPDTVKAYCAIWPQWGPQAIALGLLLALAAFIGAAADRVEHDVREVEWVIA